MSDQVHFKKIQNVLNSTWVYLQVILSYMTNIEAGTSKVIF